MRRKPPTTEERAHMGRVADLGCIVCRNEGAGFVRACVHHLKTGMGMGQRASNFQTIPLCRVHHQDGPFGVAFHAGSREWQKNHGTETELLAQVKALLLEMEEAS